MRRHALIPALAASLACAGVLSGCLTQHVKPPPSAAVLQARAAEGKKAAACTGEKLDAVSPAEVGFGFGETTLGDVARERVAKAATWLKCNPGVEVVIQPMADNHGTAAQQQALAAGRGKAVADRLRAEGATQPVIHTLAMGAADPVTAPHLLIVARGRGW
ncbi:MAG TPA: OmpA family protein [Phenylobacterium sp.]|jgi:outer membrane protein OmpA-like peptidoglycan-associated protein